MTDVDERNSIVVPLFVHEGMLARQERTIRRLWILCLIVFLAFVGSNIAWICYENQFEEIVITQDGQADDSGNVSINGVANGDLYTYGESETNDKGQEKKDRR